MNRRIFFWSLTSALAGFLFGFDTVVISGAEKTIQALWGLSDNLHGIAVASALYGTVVGSLLGGWPADRFGRKATLLWIGVLYLLGAAGSALKVLQQIEPELSKEAIARQADEIMAASTEQASSGQFWPRRLRKPILLAFLIAFFNQLSGINAILYFAPRIFELTGLAAKAALLQSIGIGLTNLVFTLVGLWLIDRLGRRTLLYIGSFGYIASLDLVAWAFFTGHFSIVPICIFAFIAAHAIVQGAAIWVFMPDTFPNRHRA